MSGMRQKIHYSLALEPAHQGETPVGGCQGTEPVVAKPAPQSPALAPTPCRCPSLTPSNRRVRDPYARWCGRGGAARCPPIPIIGASCPLPRVVAKVASPNPQRPFAAGNGKRATTGVCRSEPRSLSAKDTALRGWDREFESRSLQRRVCERGSVPANAPRSTDLTFL